MMADDVCYSLAWDQGAFDPSRVGRIKTVDIRRSYMYPAPQP